VSRSRQVSPRAEDVRVGDVLARAGDLLTLPRVSALASAGVGSVAVHRRPRLDLIVTGSLISRIHARIEVERNRFVLVDQSTNGTFVTTEQGRESFARRDSVTLEGRGMIGLGRLPEPTAQDAIVYQLED